MNCSGDNGYYQLLNPATRSRAELGIRDNEIQLLHINRGGASDYVNFGPTAPD